MWRKIQKTLATLIPLFLLLAYLVVTICLLNRWDSMVAVTLVPIWAWSAIGMVIALTSWVITKGTFSMVMVCLFLATGVAFSEETRGILRELSASLQSSRENDSDLGPHLRIVNVNCAGSEESLRNAVEAEPDILVIQEAPGQAILEMFADQLYGVDRSVSLHKTNAILARGELLGVLTDPETSTLHVRLKLPGGMIVDVTNLQLDGCAPRLDMWRPSVWRELIESRIKNRRLVRSSLGENEISKENFARVVCGGFGTPPGDDVYRPLDTNGLIDTYAAAGLGWGNTYPSNYPVLRLDQIWVSPNLTPVKSVTRLNSASRHRIVVSDLKLPL